jgi:hypothetical protein
VWLYSPGSVQGFDQGIFDYLSAHFQADFGVPPFIVTEVTWDCPKTTVGGSVQYDCLHKTHTDARYSWGAAGRPFSPNGNVAEVGPGYDESRLGRPNPRVVDRQGGAFFWASLYAALATHPPCVAIETWNEMHEGSGINQTKEYGRLYINEAHTLIARARS